MYAPPRSTASRDLDDGQRPVETGVAHAPAEDAAHERSVDRLLVLGVVTVGVAVGILRWWGFRAAAFDTGFLAHVASNVAAGRGDLTSLNGSHHFADHFSPLLLVFSPIARWAPGALVPAMLAAQGASLGGVAWAVLDTGRRLGLTRRRVLRVLALSFCTPGVWFWLNSEFHTLGLALGPLAILVGRLMVRAASAANPPMAPGTTSSGAGRSPAIHASRPDWPMWLWAVVVVAARSQLALGLLIAAVVVSVISRRRPPAWSWAPPTLALVASAGWSATRPAHGSSVDGHLGHIADAGGLGAVLTGDPLLLFSPLGQLLLWFSLVIWGLAITPRVLSGSGPWLLVGAPVLAIPILGVWEAADLPMAHYWHVLVATGAVASVWVAAHELPATTESDQSDGGACIGAGSHPDRSAWQSVAAAWMVTVLLFVLVGENGLPTPRSDRSDIEWGLEQVASTDGSVAAPSWMVPRLVHRAELHILPLPVACPDQAVAGYRPPAFLPSQVIAPESFDMAEILSDAGYELVASQGDYGDWRLADERPVGPLACAVLTEG